MMYARITDDTGGTIFVNEVQPEPTSPGHDYERSSPNRNTGHSGSRQYASHIYEEPELQESDTYSTPYH
jgi:hypothetical protein